MTRFYTEEQKQRRRDLQKKFGFNAGKFTATDDDFAKLVYALVEQGFGKG